MKKILQIMLIVNFYVFAYQEIYCSIDKKDTVRMPIREVKYSTPNSLKLPNSGAWITNCANYNSHIVMFDGYRYGYTKITGEALSCAINQVGRKCLQEQSIRFFDNIYEYYKGNLNTLGRGVYPRVVGDTYEERSIKENFKHPEIFSIAGRYPTMTKANVYSGNYIFAAAYYYCLGMPFDETSLKSSRGLKFNPYGDNPFISRYETKELYCRGKPNVDYRCVPIDDNFRKNLKKASKLSDEEYMKVLDKFAKDNNLPSSYWENSYDSHDCD